jgi:hypothetical protein
LFDIETLIEKHRHGDQQHTPTPLRQSSARLRRKPGVAQQLAQLAPKDNIAQATGNLFNINNQVFNNEAPPNEARPSIASCEQRLASSRAATPPRPTR